ncbi:hypothetical protein ERO13_D11G222100v2 [Gossypium hirsutum]|uniref:Uncharacterized protein n=3 Tax=Gossypium TaxID=3633 RepID=A0A1U8K5R1_GOSHI|nr:uncharacterized protein LOC107913669 [Gossypium hirsutum]KAG4121672.1 hypothetical protein ERO13_D11G222100v2 [Gossypium hirsutum]TYH45219.1 hypothetical protein ES332_D11G249800v1 [Gossypium tomentosum]
MALPIYFSLGKIHVFCLALFMLISMLLCASIENHELQTNGVGARRRLLELKEQDDQHLSVKKTPSLSTKNNQTKLIKSSTLSTKNQTKLITSKLSTKNQTKLSKPIKSTKATTLSSTLSKSKLIRPKNNVTTKTLQGKKMTDAHEPSKPKNNLSNVKNPTSQKPKQPSSIHQEYDPDLVAEFKDLPTKIQGTLLPDLEKITTTSKAYITKYNKQITKQFKPYVGNKYAPTIATIYSCAVLLIPLLLVSLIFNRVKAYFSLQKILISIQVYLSIYFSILCLTSLVTGLEPLKFFYATSPSTYVWLQVVQTLGYVVYLLLLLMYLVLVFSTESGLGSRMLGLGQTFVGFTVGLHYYVAVFHRVVLRQPPKTNWKVHGIYATSFLVICLCARNDGRKKAYLEEGGEEGKNN